MRLLIKVSCREFVSFFLKCYACIKMMFYSQKLPVKMIFSVFKFIFIYYTVAPEDGLILCCKNAAEALSLVSGQAGPVFRSFTPVKVAVLHCENTPLQVCIVHETLLK